VALYAYQVHDDWLRHSEIVRGYTGTHRQRRDLISLLFCFRNKENRVKGGESSRKVVCCRHVHSRCYRMYCHPNSDYFYICRALKLSRESWNMVCPSTPVSGKLEPAGVWRWRRTDHALKPHTCKYVGTLQHNTENQRDALPHFEQKWR
jgi:hypothetical protein